jgi:hypothetical protein
MKRQSFCLFEKKKSRQNDDLNVYRYVFPYVLHDIIFTNYRVYISKFHMYMCLHTRAFFVIILFELADNSFSLIAIDIIEPKIRTFRFEPFLKEKILLICLTVKE